MIEKKSKNKKINKYLFPLMEATFCCRGRIEYIYSCFKEIKRIINQREEEKEIDWNLLSFITGMFLLLKGLSPLSEFDIVIGGFFILWGALGLIYYIVETIEKLKLK